MNILIAKSVVECEQWTEVSVVIDVLRAGTTACALLHSGKAEVLVFDDLSRADTFLQTHSQFEAYAEGNLALSHKDNSPYLASKSAAAVPALLLTQFGTKAALNLKESSCVLMGGFCNFGALAAALRSQSKDVLIVPASLYGTADDVEDGLCAAALKDFIQGVGQPQDAINDFYSTIRYVEFRKHGPKTAAKDAKLAFQLNSIPVVPQVSFSSEGYGVCHVFGKPAPAQWMGTAVPQKTEQAPAQEPEETAFQSEKLVPLSPLGEPPAEPNPAEKPEQTEKPDEAVSKLKPAVSALEQAAAQGISSLKEKAPKGLKNFFSDILKVVKEEKEELVQDAASLGHLQEDAHPDHSAEPQSDDLLDAVLKKNPQLSNTSAAEPAPVVQPEPDLHRVSLSPSQPEQEDPQPGEITFSSTQPLADGNRRKKAIVLFSGGLDSTTCLYWALAHGYTCEALTVSYGQRHDREVLAAQMIARNLGVKHHLITLDLPWLACCSLVDKKQALPDVAVEDIPKAGIPSTYVPGRNLMFLSIAGSLLDAVGADAIVAGPNAVDFSGYPDCTPAFFKAAAEALNRGTKTGVSEGIEVLAPLMRLSKAQIVKLGAQLKVPFELTWSCYAGGQKPCGHCDSCKLRAKGFAEAGVHDTALD